MSLSSTLSALGVARLRPALAAAGVAALLAACGDASTAPSAPSVNEPAERPSLTYTSTTTTTTKVLRFNQTCTGTTCTFDASPSSGFWGFTWLFLDGSANSTGVGTVVTHTFPANGSFPLVLRATHSTGTGQIMKTVVCTAGNCF